MPLAAILLRQHHYGVSRKKQLDTRGRSADRPLVVAVALIALNFFVYSAVRHFDFVNWDDPSYLTENTNVQSGLSWSNIVWALTTSHSPYWHPLTWMSHMLDVTLYGMNPGPHHVTSLIIHIGSTLLLFAVFRRMTHAAGASAFVAAMFAVHPLHVESVAWLAERKDVLSTFFLMLTMWAYVRYVERPARARYLAVVVAYTLALMSKPMVVTLPFVLLLLDVWPLRRVIAGRPNQPPPRLRRTAEASAKAEGLRYGSGRPIGAAQGFSPATAAGVVIEKLPLIALALVTSLATLIVQRQVGAVAGLDVLPLRLRAANALVGYVAYVWKTIWPTRLAAFYPFRMQPGWKVALAAAALATGTAVAVRVRQRYPYVFVGWLWYLIAVAPVIGLMQAGEQAMADRFMYVPMIGLLMIVAWTVQGWPTADGSQLMARGLRLMAVSLVVGFAVTARAQAAHWADSLTLWQHAARVVPDNYIAYENMGQALRERGQLEDALESYKKALTMIPSHSPALEAMIRNDLGLVLTRQGKSEEALPQFDAAIRLNPAFAEAQINLGNALAADGRYTEAAGHYATALSTKPNLTEGRVGLGGVLLKEGRAEEAGAQYSAALGLDPNLAQAHNGMGAALAMKGQDASAMSEYREALRLKPDLVTVHLNIAALLIKEGRIDEARGHLETALSIDPGYEPARQLLGRLR
ncbi:MAG TPA: tetratricopeptide repeat protein [Vicinamibacterales bacterium]|nr:tetratricopeptide repeat protein [Vicinamibacterales bacterium]